MVYGIWDMGYGAWDMDIDGDGGVSDSESDDSDYTDE